MAVRSPTCVHRNYGCAEGCGRVREGRRSEGEARAGGGVGGAGLAARPGPRGPPRACEHVFGREGRTGFCHLVVPACGVPARGCQSLLGARRATASQSPVPRGWWQGWAAPRACEHTEDRKGRTTCDAPGDRGNVSTRRAERGGQRVMPRSPGAGGKGETHPGHMSTRLGREGRTGYGRDGGVGGA